MKLKQKRSMKKEELKKLNEAMASGVVKQCFARHFFSKSWLTLLDECFWEIGHKKWARPFDQNSSNFLLTKKTWII